MPSLAELTPTTVYDLSRLALRIKLLRQDLSNPVVSPTGRAHISHDLDEALKDLDAVTLHTYAERNSADNFRAAAQAVRNFDESEPAQEELR